MLRANAPTYVPPEGSTNPTQLQVHPQPVSEVARSSILEQLEYFAHFEEIRDVRLKRIIDLSFAGSIPQNMLAELSYPSSMPLCRARFKTIKN